MSIDARDDFSVWSCRPGYRWQAGVKVPLPSNVVRDASRHQVHGPVN